MLHRQEDLCKVRPLITVDARKVSLTCERLRLEHAVTDWDDDIAAMSLSDFEKNGLQVYRNYQRAFEKHAESELAKEIDAETFNTANLERVLKLMVTEDARFLPVIACAYADDRLKAMFKAEIADDVPGGKSKLFGPYGPFADLFKRLQLAFIFEMLSPELVADFDRLRETRNELSHTWDIAKLDEFFTRGRVSEVFPIETILGDRPDWFPDLTSPLCALQAFRLRMIWMLARLAYEAPLYARARHRRLNPEKALYGPNKPERLTEVSRLASVASREVVYPANRP